MKNLRLRQYIIYILLLAGGLFLGWLIFHQDQQGRNTDNTTDEQSVTADANETVWTCSMHPHIRMDKPGKCPICGMDLIPLSQMQTDTATHDPLAIHLTPEAAQLANVMTSVVSRQKAVKKIRLYGRIQADERLLQSQTAHIPGRIERLQVNFTGELVRRGQPLAEIYSPEIITAQQELLEAAKVKDIQPEIYEASRERLTYWNIPVEQINAIESSGKVRTTFPIVSTTSGIVTARRVNTGDHVAQGTVLYDIADLSTVWAMFDAYESDLPFLAQGDKITFTSQALPGESYSGTIDFIDPVIDPVNRVAKVRLQVKNSNGKLKPDMFITGVLEADLKKFENSLVIPRSAVLWTGKRSIVYVKLKETDQPVFRMREIETGPALGNSYIVLSGLSDGEEIVTSGTFNIDAAAQLEGKPSMMNPEGGASSSGHDHDDKLEKPDNSQTKDEHSDHQINEVNKGADMKSTAKMTQHQMFKVSGNCEMCKERIETAAKSVKGVTSAIWDVDTKIIHVNFNPTLTDLTQLQKAVAKAGHDTEKFKADDKTYNSLPDCCKYRAS